MDVLTRCLVSLYEEPEKPADALQYVRSTLGAASPDKVELESLRLVVAEMKEKVGRQPQSGRGIGFLITVQCSVTREEERIRVTRKTVSGLFLWLFQSPPQVILSLPPLCQMTFGAV